VLFGEDEFSLHQSLQEIKRGMGDQSALATNTAVLSGKQLTLDQLRNVCETVPFLAERRLVIVEGLLERFEPGTRSASKKRKKPLPDQRDERKSLVAYIDRIPDFTTLVLVDGKIGSRNLLLADLSAKAKVRSFPLLKDIKLRQWIVRQVKESGGSISPQATDLLARYVGGNLWIMANEIEKLALFAGGCRIGEEDIRAVVSYAQEANVFAMVDAILEFKGSEAVRLMRKLLQQGAAPAYLLVMLSRQTRMIVRMRELIGQGKAKTEIQGKLGLSSDFVLRKVSDQAGRYSLARIIEVYHKLLEADLSIKAGRFDGELALNILVAELCR